MKVHKVVILCCILLGFLNSCNKDVTPPDAGYGYFPTKIGNWIIYDVVSIEHDAPISKHDTSIFQLKEVIESTFLDNENRETQRIERYTRNDETQPWVIKDVWFSNLTASTAERVEENERLIKLTFPVKKGKTWDGNALNSQDVWIYKYTEVNVPYTINNFSFDSTVTVLQIDEENLVEKKYALEIYAKNAGMIYKELILLNTEIDGTITIGSELTMKINSYGK